MKSHYDLVNDPIPGLIRKLAIPASVGFLFNTMFNVVDTWFGGLISTDALASLSLSFPVFFIIIAIGSGIGTGTTVLIANAIGAGDHEKAELYAAQSISFGLIVSTLITVFGFVSSPVLFSFLGASGVYLEIVLSYMNVIFAGTVFFIITNVLNAPLTASGNTKMFRNILVAGSLLNLLFDPWFVFGGFGLQPLGFKGIALSTVVIQGFCCGYLGWVVTRRRLLSGDLRNQIFPRPDVLKELAVHAIPASINMLTVGLGIFIITYFVSHFGKNAVAAYGIATRIEQIVLLPTIGLNMATLAIVGQNFGAGDKLSRLKEAIHRAIGYGFVMMLLGGAGVFALSSELMALFTSDPEVITIGTQYLRIAAFILWAYVILFVETSALQGMKKPMYAIGIGIFRQVAAPVLVFYLLAHVLKWQLIGIWWGLFLITWSAALYTRYYTWRTLRKYEDGSG
jgi:putative MATE family efflux protein